MTNKPCHAKTKKSFRIFTFFRLTAILTELNSKSSSLLVNTVMEETGGVGVDIFIDNGGKI